METGLTEEKASKYSDTYVKLTEKQRDFSQEMGGREEPKAESESGQLISRLKRLFAFIEKQGGLKAQNCVHVGKDRYCRYWTWPTEPTELSRSPKKDDDGLVHVQATPLIVCYAVRSRSKVRRPRRDERLNE
jgi:hypothetical protein